MLQKRSIEACREFMKLWNLPYPEDDNVAWISLHKTITSVVTLPMADRTKSKIWLLDRGYMPHDDGDVPVTLDNSSN
jgi:hypothetical protein